MNEIPAYPKQKIFLFEPWA